MEDQYGISDLRQFINRATVPQYPPFPQQPSLPPSSDLFSAHHHHCGLSPPAPAQYEMVVMGRSMSDMLHHSTTSSGAFHRHKEHQHQLHFNSDSTTTTATATTNSRNSGGFDGGDGGAARWPRQETLTLLEIRSKLDHKFKEANQKGPLWDEVARIMSEEHGYQRTGKKCREKFENLYKYYKKTKEGKAGRQDGKHYRFFRQLEALYGEHHTHHHTITSTSDAHHFAGNVPHFHDNSVNIIQSKLATSDNHQMLQPASVSLSNSSDYETLSSDDDDVGGSIESDDSSKKKKKKKRRGKRSWKAKVKEFIDHQMRKIMEKQEAWLEKMMKTMESREMERIEREEEWRKKEVERMEREHKFWASERAWIEARDSALMNALEKLTNTREREVNEADHHHRCRSGIIHPDNQWLETEVTRLIQLRTSMESRFQQCGFSEEVLWEDIAAKMAYLGYDRSAIVCKEKWDSLNKSYFQEKDNIIRDNEGCKKRKENYGEVSNNSYNTTTNNSNNHNEGGLCMNQMGGFGNNCEINETRLQLNEEASSPSSHNSNANVNLKANVNASSSVGVGVGVGVGGGGGGGGGGASVMNDGCLRFFLGDCSDGLGWESTSYGLKLNNGGNQCA